MKFTLGLLSLLLFSCATKSKEKAPMGEKLFAYAPKESSLIVYTNIRSIVESNIIKDEINENIASLSSEAKKQYDDFIELTGFNVKKDLNEVLIAGRPSEESKEDFIVAIQANYNENKLIEFAKNKVKEEGEELLISSKKIGTATVYTLRSANDENAYGDHALNIACLDNSLILLGSEERLEKALSQKESVLNNTAYMAKLNQVKANHFYAVLDAKDLKNSVKEDNPYKKTIDFLDDVALAMSFDEEVHLSLLSNCLEAAQAEEVESILRGMLGIIRLGLSQERELIDLMNEVEIERNGSQVKLELDVDRKRLEMLKNYKPNMKKI